jgi:hypothetical protein
MSFLEIDQLTLLSHFNKEPCVKIFVTFIMLLYHRQNDDHISQSHSIKVKGKNILYSFYLKI